MQNRLSMSLGLSPCGTQFPCFWMYPAAFKRFETLAPTNGSPKWKGLEEKRKGRYGSGNKNRRKYGLAGLRDLSCRKNDTCSVSKEIESKYRSTGNCAHWRLWAHACKITRRYKILCSVRGRLHKWCKVRFLKNKSDVFRVFKEYKTLMEKQFGKLIKKLQSDNGTEFCNAEFDDFLTRNGIKRRSLSDTHRSRTEYLKEETGHWWKWPGVWCSHQICPLISGQKQSQRPTTLETDVHQKVWTVELHTSYY